MEERRAENIKMIQDIADLKANFKYTKDVLDSVKTTLDDIHDQLDAWASKWMEFGGLSTAIQEVGRRVGVLETWKQGVAPLIEKSQEHLNATDQTKKHIWGAVWEVIKGVALAAALIYLGLKP